jgi:aldose 1-epimerase
VTTPVSPSGTSWTISAGPYEATVVSVGGGLRELTYDGQPLVLGYGPDEQARAALGQLLIPWPNRIADGRYSFDGAEQQLALTEPDRHNASHGLVRWAEWSRQGDEPDRAVLTHRLHGQPGYPHQLDLTATYTLDPDRGLTVEVGAVNVGAGRAPYGFGAHPYLTVGRPVDECELSFTAGRRLETDPDRLLPTGLTGVAGTEFDFSTPRRIGELEINSAFTGLGDTWAVRLSAGERAVTLRSDAAWVQLFTAEALDRAGLAVEPMSCPPNAFASGTDLIVLDPGGTHHTTFTITASR